MDSLKIFKMYCLKTVTAYLQEYPAKYSISTTSWNLMKWVNTAKYWKYKIQKRLTFPLASLGFQDRTILALKMGGEWNRSLIMALIGKIKSGNHLNKKIKRLQIHFKPKRK